MKRIAAVLAVVLLTLALCATVGAATEKSFYATMEYTKDGDTVELILSADRIKADFTDFYGIHYKLRYDPDKLELVTEKDHENVLQCVEKVPAGWDENLSVAKTPGEAEIWLAALIATKAEPVKGKDDLVLKLRFRIKGELTEDTSVVLVTAQAIGASIRTVEGGLCKVDLSPEKPSGTGSEIVSEDIPSEYIAPSETSELSFPLGLEPTTAPVSDGMSDMVWVLVIVGAVLAAVIVTIVMITVKKNNEAE